MLVKKFSFQRISAPILKIMHFALYLNFHEAFDNGRLKV